MDHEPMRIYPPRAWKGVEADATESRRSEEPPVKVFCSRELERRSVPRRQVNEGLKRRIEEAR